MDKMLILNYISDYGGQGTIRNLIPFTHMNMKFGKNYDLVNQFSQFIIFDENILKNISTIFFQRLTSSYQLSHIRRYKQLQSRYGYKMVWDCDDFLWGRNEKQGGNEFDGIPTYNFTWSNIKEEDKSNSIEIMKLMDVVTVSTEFLKNFIVNTLGIKTRVEVIPNTVPKSMYGYHNFKLREEEIKKPKVIYTGSQTHYNNKTKQFGDWDNAFKDWVIDSVLNERIDFHIIGGLPFFFEDIKEKIKIYPWLEYYELHQKIKEIQPDFCINPLTPNNFNFSKSDLKMVESSALGMLCIGTVFDKEKVSPYQDCVIPINYKASKQEIQKTLKSIYTNKDKFNELLMKQYKWFDENYRYSEDDKNIERILKAILPEGKFSQIKTKYKL